MIDESMYKTHVRVPVKLTKALWLQLENSSSNCFRDGKVGGIDLAESAPLPRDRLRGMIVCVVDIGAVALQSALGFLLEILTDSAVENIRELRRDLVKDRRVHAKVFREDFRRGMGHPVIDHEGGSVPSVKDVSHVRGIGTYPIFSKSPSSKARRYSFSSSNPWTLWATPLGKYQMSPVLSFSVVKPPFSSTPLKRRDPL